MAVVAVPVMAAVGIAVDYSRVNAAPTAFQVALDATALTLSKDAATESTMPSRPRPRTLSIHFSVGLKSPTLR